MRRGRIFIFLILIVIVGVVVLALGLGLFKPNPQSVATETTGVKVYYASQNIPLGTTITEDMLGTFTLPKENEAEIMFIEDEKANLVSKEAQFTLDQGT